MGLGGERVVPSIIAACSLALGAACGSDAPGSTSQPQAVFDSPPDAPGVHLSSDFEAVVRPPAESGDKVVAIALEGETRLATWFELPHTRRVCNEVAADMAGSTLRIGLGTLARGVRLEASAAGREIAQLEFSGGWTDLRFASDQLDMAGCTEIRIQGPEGSRVAISRPLVVRQGRRRPWVIIYLVDTLRFDQLAAKVGSSPIAPAFDRFAAEGISYRRAMATSSWTRSTVASLFTGLLPADHGVYGFGDRLPRSVAALPGLFADAGYLTVALSTNPNILPEWGFLPGFDRFVDLEARLGASRHRGYARLIELATEITSQESDVPVFLYLHDNGLHFPYQAPSRYRAIFAAPAAGDPAEKPKSASDLETVARARLLYAAATRAASERFEQLINALRRSGRYDESVLVLVGDHGEEFGEHGSLRHGKTLYQEQLHVPLVIKPPKGFAQSGEVAMAVSTVDVAPTLLAYANIKPPPHMAGRGLPAPGGLGDLDAADRLVVSELELLNESGASVIEWPWKYLTTTGGEAALFDLAGDPRELKDLSGVHPQLVSRLKGALADVRLASRKGLAVTCVAGARPAVVELRLAAVDGVLENLTPFAFEESDSLSVIGSVSRASLRLAPSLRLPGFRPKDLSRRKPDHDSLRAEDFSAGGLQIEAMLTEGRGTVRLIGAAGRALRPDGGTIELAEIEAVSSIRHFKQAADPTCYVSYVRANAESGAGAPVDSHLLRRLEALGYVE